MSDKLSSYGFPRSVQEIVRPILEALETGSSQAFSVELAKLALKVVSQIEEGTLTPQEADQYFTLIDLYITDNCSNVVLTKDVKDLLFEGMILHDYGKNYGADLGVMKSLAAKLLRAT